MIDSIKVSDSCWSVAKISADSIDQDSLRKKIMEILLEDPDSEIKNLSESFLVQYLEDAINDIEKNPVLTKFFQKLDERYKKLEQQVEDAINKSIPDELRFSIYSSEGKIYNHQGALLDCIEALSYLLGRVWDDNRQKEDPYAARTFNEYELENIIRKVNNAKDKIYYN